ncbi:MAG: hypothetical protein VZS44_09140 [Bacilli bacterium]|nr:hypothetical protein [Bacilli bacterium]
MKKFRDNATGKLIEVERETKTLILKSIYNTDYYKGKNHDAFTFLDTEGNKYIYNATLNADMTEYDTNIAKELVFQEDKHIKLSAYFVPTEFNGEYFIYNPRLLNIEE